MQEIGEVLHVAGSGRVIIRLSEAVPEGSVLWDRRGTRIAKVQEIIGPIGAPFASAVPLTNTVKKYMGAAVFIGMTADTKRSPADAKRRKRRRAR